MPKISAKFQRHASPPTGAPNRGGVCSHQRFSTNISLYLRNGAREGHTFYGRLIGTHMRSIEWRYFQWPWVTLTTPSHPIFDILRRIPYFRNGWRQAFQIWWVDLSQHVPACRRQIVPDTGVVMVTCHVTNFRILHPMKYIRNG